MSIPLTVTLFSQNYSNVYLNVRAVILTILTLFALQLNAANVTINVALDNGEIVKVRQVGIAMANSDIRNLVLMADRSTVSKDTTVAINGSMQENDYIAITNNMLVWFDTTREVKYFSGGGGMLRGVWQLVPNGTNNLRFKYTEGKWTPNNLFPGQIPPNGRGDAYQILVSKQSSGIDVFRATGTDVTIVNNSGTYDSTAATLSYSFSGTMRSGTGVEPYLYNENFGVSASQPAKLRYDATYRIYANAQGNNGYRIDCNFKVYIASDAGLYNSAPVESVVYSLGMSNTTLTYDEIKLPYLKPLNKTWIRGFWTRNSSGQLYNNNGDTTAVGNIRYVPDPTGSAPQQDYIMGNIFTNANDVIQVKYPSATGSGFASALRLRVHSSVNASPGINIYYIGSYMQYIYDLSEKGFVQDIKVGDFAQGGDDGVIGVMVKGSYITSVNTLYFDYATE
jgi:hypothetical protein